MKHLLALALGLVGWILVPEAASAQVGARFAENTEFKQLVQTPAKSFEDYAGRLVLVEIFAHW
jgi:hypothetical protein